MMKKELPQSLAKWNDKIWLHHWFQRTGIPGPEIVLMSNAKESVEKRLKSMSTFCFKPSHLSNSQGVVVVKDNVLVADVDFKWITGSIPTALRRLRKNARIEAGTLDALMAFLYDIRPTWEDAARRAVPPGWVVETVRPSRAEYKVWVGCGRVLDMRRLHDAKRSPNDTALRDLASKVALLSGVDFVRVDIFEDSQGDLRVSEFTFNPGVRGPTTPEMNLAFKNTVVAWHSKRNEMIRLASESIGG
jgi:hypothetical protein